MLKRPFMSRPCPLGHVIFAALVAVVAAAAPLHAAEEKSAVIELFTSQGCSSCPPADRLMGELIEEPGLLALSFPVDYWDFLGWKDTLASPAFSERQRAYARSRGDRDVYTPQMVINGRVHAIGSYRDQIKAGLADTSAAFEAERVAVGLALDGNRLKISIGQLSSGRAIEDATIWLALYNRAETVKIARGENRGRTITYYNVVRELVPIGMWSGEAREISLPRGDLLQPGYDSCAVIVQAHDTGPIYGVAALENPATN